MVSMRTVPLMVIAGMLSSDSAWTKTSFQKAGFEVRLHLGQVVVGSGSHGRGVP